MFRVNEMTPADNQEFKFDSYGDCINMTHCLLICLLFWTWKPVLRCRPSKVHIQLGKPQGVGILEWGGNGEGMEWGNQFTSNLGPRWTGSYHSKEGSK
jgi:hypothetical protein